MKIEFLGVQLDGQKATLLYDKLKKESLFFFVKKIQKNH